MKSYRLNLRITADRYLDYYRGTVRQVMAHCDTGQVIQFPASLLQKHVTNEGIFGVFILTCDDHNKCIGLEKQD